MPSNAKGPNVLVAKQILNYFLRNPGAADSLTEIARWRLMEEAVRRNVEATSAALDWLISQGYLREESHRGTEPLFLLNAQRREAAEEFLKKDPEVGDAKRES